MTAPRTNADTTATALPRRETTSRAGIVAAAARTGGKVWETDEAGQ